MKLIITIALACFMLTEAKCQVDTTNIFYPILTSHYIKSNQKPTFFYTIVSWCGENLEDISILDDTIKKYRQDINLIVLLDTNLIKSKKYYNDFKSLKADTILILNNYFKTCFKKKGEAKEYAKQINRVFRSSLKIIGPSAFFCFYEKKINFFSVLRPNSELSSYLTKISTKK